MVSAATERLPLFPLRTVLLPGATLRLRVFERRYLDLVRDCLRQGSGFGICLILEGAEVGAPAIPAAVGTEARIDDFESTPEGLLGITVRGHRRFHVERTHVRDDGLIIADVHWREADRGGCVAPEHGLLATLLRSLLEGLRQLPSDLRLLDDAAWVGWQLAQLLPLAPAQRQALLQLDTAPARLDALLHLLPQLRGD